MLRTPTSLPLRNRPPPSFFFFFFNDTATTEIYTLSLHDALPIFRVVILVRVTAPVPDVRRQLPRPVALPLEAHHVLARVDRKSTRLNSSHTVISYAVFCLKKKKKLNPRHDFQPKSQGAGDSCARC